MWGNRLTVQKHSPFLALLGGPHFIIRLLFLFQKEEEEEEDTHDDASSSSSSSKGDILLSNVLLPSSPLAVFVSVLYAPKRRKKIIVPTRNIGEQRRGKCERRGDRPTMTPRERSSNYHCHSSQGTTTTTTTDERKPDEEK